MLPMIEFLIKIGSEVNQADKGGRSAFLMACHWDLKLIVKFLLQHNADIDADAENRVIIC